MSSMAPVAGPPQSVGVTNTPPAKPALDTDDTLD